MSDTVPLNIPDIFSEITNKKSDSVSSLSSEFQKSKFTKLRIIGQFNKGFIMACYDESQDLFIIDQHAADEKYMFETLQSSTSIDKQPLVVQQYLRLNPSEES